MVIGIRALMSPAWARAGKECEGEFPDVAKCSVWICVLVLYLYTYAKNSLSGMFKNQCSLLLPGKAQ